MRHLLTGITILIAFGLPLMSWSKPCPREFHEILKSIYYSKKELQLLRETRGNSFRSSWGKVETPKNLNGEYQKLKFDRPWNLKLPIGIGTFGEKNPDFVMILDDICRYQLDFDDFELEFERVFHRTPTEVDFRRFYFSRMQLFQNGMDHWFKRLQEVDPEGVALIHRSFDRRIEGLNKVIAKFPIEGGIEETKEAIRSARNQVVGTLGEFYAFMAIPKVTSASVLVSQMPLVSKKMEATFRLWEEKLAENPARFVELEEHYPNIFKSEMVNRFTELNPKAGAKEKLKFLKGWMKSKEIDFIRQNGEKETWLEIKTRRKPFTWEEFISKHGGKPPINQILEDKEILEFLGLDHQISLEYGVTSEIDPVVKAQLDQLGVKTLEFKDPRTRP